MKFQQELEAKKHSGWKSAYIDYGGLKATLHLVQEKVNNASESESASVLQQKRQFQYELDEQILKILGFFAVKERELQWRLRQVKAFDRWEAGTPWIELARDTVLLLHFLHLNYQGMRKIHKKYCKITEPIRPKEAQERGGLVLHFGRPPGDTQREHEHVSFLQPDLVSDLHKMQEHSTLRQLVRELRQKLSQLRDEEMNTVERSSLDVDQARNDLAQLQLRDHDATLSASMSTNDDNPHSDDQKRVPFEQYSANLLDMTRSISTSEEHGYQSCQHQPQGADERLALLDELIAKLEHAECAAEEGASLVTTATFVSAQAGIFEGATPGLKVTRAVIVGLMLNLLSVFIFMANYTLVIPSTSAFARHLDLPPTFAGVIIGAADITMIASALLYSIWTNRAFKAPLAFGALCCALGNVLYSSAYDFNSSWMLVSGRLLLGFGGTRAVSRRFIADFIGSASRTTASVGFVVASTMGMAVGPMTAFPLRSLPSVKIIDGGDVTLTINTLTAPGYAMALLWLLLILVYVVVMRDPKQVVSTPLEKPLLGGRGTAPSSGGNDDDDAYINKNESNNLCGDESEDDQQHQRLQSQLERGHPNANVTQHHQHEQSLRTYQSVQSATNDDDDDDDDDNDDDDSHKDYLTTWRGNAGQGPAAATCLFAIYALKAVQEAACTAMPLLVDKMFGLGSAQSGLLLGVLLIATLPVNFAAGAFAKFLGERTLMLIANGCLLLSSIALMHPPKYTTTEGSCSLAGTIAALSGNLVGTTVLEGVAYSILSKRMPAAMTQGILNAGFLATCGGTLGRLTGNAFVACFNVRGTSTLEDVLVYGNLLFGSCALLSLGTTFASLATWRRLLSP